MNTEIYSEYENFVSSQTPFELETQPNLITNIVPTDLNYKVADKDLKNLVELFSKVKLKKPTLHLVDENYKVKISKAPDYGRNKGCLYVTYSKFYVGKITPNGVYIFTRTLDSPNFNEKKILDFLLTINENPVDQIEKQGKSIGVCCCCGLKLTNAESVARGIGPICLDNWGL